METTKETKTQLKFEPRWFSDRYAELECGVFVVHYRENGRPRGTIAAIVLPTGEYWFGVALSNPSDQFVKKVGRAKAIGRAFGNYHKWAAPNGTINFSLGGWSKKLVESLKFETMKVLSVVNGSRRIK